MKKIIYLIFLSLFVFVFQSSALQIGIIGRNSTCGNNNGFATLYISSGTSPYTFLWSTGETTNSISNLAAGTYYATVTDNTGTTGTDSIVIADDPFISNAKMAFNAPSSSGGSWPCPGLCNGIATLVPQTNIYPTITGTPPYTLSIINNGQNPNLQIVTNPPGLINICGNENYQLIVTDSYGCTGSVESTGVPTSINDTGFYQVSVVGACNGSKNGKIIIDETQIEYVPGFIVEYTGPSGYFGSLFFDTWYPLVLDTLLPGTYTVNIAFNYSAQPCGQSFTVVVPDLGANCGVISGKVYLDTLRDCSIAVGEPLMPNRLIKFTPGNYYATSDSTGNYSAHLPYGVYNASTVATANYFSVCDSSGIILNAVNDSITNVNLGDSVNISSDVGVSMYSSALRPGFNCTVYLSEKNYGYLSCPSSAVRLVFPPFASFISCNLPYTFWGSNDVEIDFTTLNSFDIKNCQVVFAIAPDPNLIGTTAVFTANALIGCADMNSANNTTTINPLITGSLDPNDKVVEPMTGIDNFLLVDIDSLLRYTIRFQNTGTDTAFNIVVIDTLDDVNLNISSFEFSGSSHPSQWEITGRNILKVYFNNILLPDSNTNEAASHGAFSYKIYTKQFTELPQIPAIVYNRADIYFDFNPPVSTNTIFNTLDISVGLNEKSVSENDLLIYPNPTNNILHISSKQKQIVNVRVYDLQGRIVLERIKFSDSSINLSAIRSGVYLVEADVSDSNGMTYPLKPQRIIKK